VTFARRFHKNRATQQQGKCSHLAHWILLEVISLDCLWHQFAVKVHLVKVVFITHFSRSLLVLSATSSFSSVFSKSSLALSSLKLRLLICSSAYKNTNISANRSGSFARLLTTFDTATITNISGSNEATVYILRQNRFPFSNKVFCHTDRNAVRFK